VGPATDAGGSHPGTTGQPAAVGRGRRQLHLRPWRELAALWALRQGAPALEVFLRRNQHFQESIPTAALRAVDVVIGFDTSSWILAERCRDLGRRFILDQSIAHPLWKKRVFETVAARYPDWRESLVPPLPAMLAHEAQEHALADTIVVASSFTTRSLVAHGVPVERIVCNPYGLTWRPSRHVRRRRPAAPFAFCFLVR
jgi:starch synthase